MIGRRDFLRTAGAALVGLIAAPVRRVLPAPTTPKPIAAPIAPVELPAWGTLEVFTQGGTRLMSFAIPDAPEATMRDGKMSMAFSPAPTTIEASGTPHEARISRITPDGAEHFLTMSSGVGCGELAFNCHPVAGGKSTISTQAIGENYAGSFEPSGDEWLSDDYRDPWGRDTPSRKADHARVGWNQSGGNTGDRAKGAGGCKTPGRR